MYVILTQLFYIFTVEVHPTFELAAIQIGLNGFFKNCLSKKAVKLVLFHKFLIGLNDKIKVCSSVHQQRAV